MICCYSNCKEKQNFSINQLNGRFFIYFIDFCRLSWLSGCVNVSFFFIESTLIISYLFKKLVSEW